MRGKRSPLQAAQASNPASEPEYVGASERAACADKTSDTAIAIEPGLTADVSLLPEAQRASDDRKTLVEVVARIRQMRKPFGAQTQKLALPKRPGYHRHWFNDVGGRVDEAKESGWAHINGQDGKPLKRAVGTGRDNGVLNAYAMELPEVFWQEDMDARHTEAQSKMDAIKESPARAKPGQASKADVGKFYNPMEDSGQGPVTISNK